MINDPPAELQGTDPATQAFEQMRGEMALVRRAVEKLAAERADIIISDYSATLGEIAQRLSATATGMKTLAAQPAMRITPDEMAGRIDTAAAKARRGDQASIAEAQTRLDRASHDLLAIVQSARAARQQRQQLHLAVVIGLITGILFWAIIPGAVARSTPRSWALPERMAAYTLRLDMWEAGERMLFHADSKRWKATVFANRVAHENREAITNCLNEARSAATPRRCSITIIPGASKVEGSTSSPR